MMVNVYFPESLDVKIGPDSKMQREFPLKWYFFTLAGLATLVGYLCICLPKVEERIDKSPPTNWNELLSVGVIFI
jgi:hypothetical protein